VDGKVTLDHNRYREPIGSRVDRSLMVRLRGAVDAVVRGAGTVRAYPYYPKTDPAAAAARQDQTLRAHPLAVVVTASCRLSLDSAFFREAPRRPVVLTSKDADPALVERVRQVAEVEMLDSFHPVPGEGPGSQTAPQGAPQAGAGFD